MFRFRFEVVQPYCPVTINYNPIIITTVAATETDARVRAYRALDGDVGLRLVSAHQLTD